MSDPPAAPDEDTDPPAPVTNPDDELDALRQVCVDHINMYRATKGLPALKRATAEQDACSDAGAKKDGDSGVAHSSSRDCARLGLPGAQNACPGYRVGGPFGGGTVEDALTKCLDQMWAEGEPPNGTQACIADSTGCFLQHGHYINMVSDYQVVSCGFYEMSDGRWWMNQNFGR